MSGIPGDGGSSGGGGGGGSSSGGDGDVRAAAEHARARGAVKK